MLKIPEISDEYFCELLSYVSEKRRSRIQRLHDDRKQRQSAFAELLLRAVLCVKKGMQNELLVLRKTPKGKPYLPESRFEFSLSHTESLAAAAVSDCPVGVDVELIRKIDERLCQRFFSKQEQEYVFSESSDRQNRFFEIWTRKEAAVKRSGEGITHDIAAIYTGKDEKSLHTFTVEDYVLSVCCDDGDIKVIPPCDTEKVLEEFLKKGGRC